MPARRKQKASSPSRRKGQQEAAPIAAVLPATPSVATSSAAATTTISDDVELMDYSALQARKQIIVERLTAISVPDLAKKRSSIGKQSKSTRSSTSPATAAASTAATVSGDESVAVPFVPKTDTHWDFVMKEMMWLGADFQGERKRQMSAAKKCASSVRQFHKTIESRRLRELAQAEVRRRKVAARIGRDVKNWWTKLEKVIAYKQKLQADEERKKAMNKQLVVLVQQTEKYTESLALHSAGDDATTSNDDNSDDEESSQTTAMDTEDTSNANDSAEDNRRRRKKKNRHRLSIEEALASGRPRKSKTSVIDYSRMKLKATEFYGESTASDASGSDGSFTAPDDSNESDDDSTLRAAMEEELQDRYRQSSKRRPVSKHQAFLADPEELRQLHEEGTMEIEKVIERLKEQPGSVDDAVTDQPSLRGSSKRVKFEKASTEALKPIARVDPGEDADDDGDASDVEDYDDRNDKSDEEYEAKEVEADDETTMAQEESLPQDISRQQEINLLKQTAEMPIEELRKMYANLGAEQESDGDSHVDPGKESDDTNPASLSDEEDFVAEEPEADDETTMAQEESMSKDVSHDEEMNLLKEGAEMPIEELRKMYAYMHAEQNSGNEWEEEKSSNVLASIDGEMDIDDENDGEYEQSDVPVVDDETTMEAEEKMGRDMTYEEELDMLNRENEMSVDELRAMYAVKDGDDSSVADDDDLHKNNLTTLLMDADPIAHLSTGSKRKRGRKSPSVREKVGKRVRRDTSPESDDGAAALMALEASAEKARKTLASRPFLLSSWVKLRLYQQSGLNWLVSMQTRRLNGILADEMGLGKTLQTISLLAYLASYKGIWGPHLVIVPTSVIINWETEIKRFCPGLKVLTYYGSAKRRKELRAGWTNTNWYHVVITSYQLAVQDAFAFKRKKWYYLILDEAQNIKNFQSQRWQTLINFNTQRRLLLTGTPLQNSLMELWSLLHFLMPYIFRSRKEFSYWFSNPMNNIIEGSSGQNDDVIKRLHGIIRPFVLRRLKKDVETQMPGKFEHIVKCQLSRRQMTLYEEFLSRSSTRQALKKGGNFMGMMNVLMQLRKCCNHPDLFEPRSVVTPFVLPSMVLRVPSRICEALGSKGALTSLSESCARPLWSGSAGLPSIGAALRHDPIEASGLRRYSTQRHPRPLEFDKKDCPSELKNLLEQIYSARQQAETSRISFQNGISHCRCSAKDFSYSTRLLNLVETDTNIFQRHSPAQVRGRRVIETPSALLALRKFEEERATDLSEILEKFVFCIPAAGAMRPVLDGGSASMHRRSGVSKDIEAMLLEPIEKILRPYQKASARLSSFFPDKKLVQYDAGKLQTLAQLLRNLKQGGHKALIFTQMSKMLDILEAFLNIHGHTYLRLDGSTGVDRRQKYMDRFNNDEKIFCFILSTRSGGMGINLTGADTVIFYDSDWNPAMDAQAQDRAHRIGQTRDVHIYRLITEHTIEENILSKAQQKKNLDILVMDKGKFDASAESSEGKLDGTGDDSIKDVYTKKGLQAILGVADEEIPYEATDDGEATKMSKEQMETAMAALEDEDDVKALRDAQKEAADELKEFDENAEIEETQDDDDNDNDGKLSSRMNKSDVRTGKENQSSINGGTQPQETSDVTDLEKEFAAWHGSVGFDDGAIESSLSPMERYGLRFREDIDPFYSIFLINEERRKFEAMDGGEEINIEQIEKDKAAEENQAVENGDLLATGIQPEDLVRQRNLYRREKARLRSDKKRRKLTGENWSQRVDGSTQNLFWYNEDTGEAIWDTPRVVTELREDDEATKKGWAKLPAKPLGHMMEFLRPYPERQSCSLVCRQWKKCANDFRFVKHVYPVEMGALANESRRKHHNHYATISDALEVALPGDSIELSDGHYYVSEPSLVVNTPIKLVGDENNPSNVVIEMSGSVQWNAKGGWIEGITFRRPKISTGELASCPMMEVKGEGRIDMIQTALDNDGSTGPVVVLTGSGNKGTWQGVTARNGGSMGMSVNGDLRVKLVDCAVKGNQKDGIAIGSKASVEMMNCKIVKNGGYGISLATGCQGLICKSHFASNMKGVLSREPHCNLSCSSNTAFVSVLPDKTIPGFKLTLQNSFEGNTVSNTLSR